MGYRPSPAFLSWAAGHKACLPKSPFFRHKENRGWDYVSTASKGWILARRALWELGQRGALHLINRFSLLPRYLAEILHQRKNIFSGLASPFLWKLTLTSSYITKQARDIWVPFPCCQTDFGPRRASPNPAGSLLRCVQQILPPRQSSYWGQGQWFLHGGLSNQSSN